MKLVPSKRKSKRVLNRILLHAEQCPHFQYRLPDERAWLDAPWVVQTVSEMRAFMYGKIGGTYRCHIRRIDAYSESWSL